MFRTWTCDISDTVELNLYEVMVLVKTTQLNHAYVVYDVETHVLQLQLHTCTMSLF